MNTCGIQMYDTHNTPCDVMRVNKSTGILHKPYTTPKFEGY
jgi:hypothetical protein